jgi:aspartate aminotransferase-like enzyme
MNGVSAPISSAPTSSAAVDDQAHDVDTPAPESPASDSGLPFQFKMATEPWEFEQIHRLNYRTFVEEIPQHHPNPDGRLVDRFHDHSVYFVCLQGRQVVGMISVHFDRPFSLDQKVPDLERYLPPHTANIAEIRLLAADKQHRGGRVFFGLMAAAGTYLVERGCDLALISGTTRQLKLYRHMGFEPFGPLVGTPGAMYQPMYLTRQRFKEFSRPLLPSLKTEDGFGAVSFQPGPVDITPEVRKAFAAEPVSHRCDQFVEDFRRTQQGLCELVGARHVQILTGSGTLANDVVAAQISLLRSRGMILSNGEFGERLADHAARMGLDFVQHAKRWGGVFDPAELDVQLAAEPTVRWLWAVHCETSTGVLNDLAALKRLAQSRGLLLCLDCISSIGTVPVDLRDVYIASGISGKGLRSYPGLSLVFHDHEIPAAPDRFPRYLDLGFYSAKSGVPFTLCSNLLYALKTAVAQANSSRRFDEIAQHGAYIRQRLQDMGLSTVGPESHTSAVISVALPGTIEAVKVGDRLADAGFHLSYKSDYLLERNWIQICLMGQYGRETIDRMLAMLHRCITRKAFPRT